MKNILINISANTIEIINSLNNKLIQKITNITSLFSNEDLEILLKYEESTLTLKYISIQGISIDGITYSTPTSYLNLLNQLKTIVVVKPTSSNGTIGDASAANQVLQKNLLDNILLQVTPSAVTPSHLELLSSGSKTLAANIYKSISLIVMTGSINIDIDGVLINNYSTNYTETWGNGISLINKSITITTNISSRVIINLTK